MSEQVTNMAQRCPECGSLKLGVSQVGVTFRLMCVACRLMIGANAKTLDSAYAENKDLLLNWDRGVRVEKPGFRLPDEATMVDGNKRVGSIVLDAVADVVPNTSAFRPVDEQRRLDAGESVGKTYTCDGCAREGDGVEVAGETVNPDGKKEPTPFYVMPAGWFLKHPSARLFCSKACVDEERNADAVAT